MLDIQGSSHDPNSLIPVILVIIVAALVFWRTVIKLLAIGVILLVALGVFDLLRGVH